MSIIFKGLSVDGKIYIYLLISLVIVVFAIVILNNVPGKVIRRLKKTKAICELNNYYSDLTIDAVCKFYVQTKSQNHPPNYEEEPGFDSGNIFKENLIKFFIKRIFNMEQKKDRFYLVLADSGMGKTTFIINLYLKYMTFWNFGRKYKMRIFAFGSEDILEEIIKIKNEEAKQTILLMDAFDEDMRFHQAYYNDLVSDQKCFKDRLDEIIEVVRRFHKVIITSRTQYFPGQEDRPYEIKIPTHDTNGFYTLEKIYLSPFNDDEIEEYLNKKYGILRFWNRNKKKIAKNIVKSSPRLMVRPMLLSYIDLLIADKLVLKSVYETYEILVKKWLDREAGKRKYSVVEREKFKEALYKYSRLIAIEIYKKRIRRMTLSLTKDEAVNIARINDIDLSDYEITGQSLLTRDALGNWKFAHRSIFEFMIAREIIENVSTLGKIYMGDMGMTRQFLEEKRGQKNECQ